MLKEYAQLNNVIFTFLAALREDELRDLTSGRARLELIYSNKAQLPAKPRIVSKKTSMICEHIETLDSREEGRKYLNSLKLKRSELIEICRFYSTGVMAKDTKATLTDKIIEMVIGAKLRSSAIYRVDVK
ncbi:MAG: hypothetical protein FWG65_02250 [Turicibacter sp.]|nr:hypothetical protein [Turicibacter sp.]